MQSSQVQRERCGHEVEGVSVLAASPLTNGPLSPTHRTVALADTPRRTFPATISRATVAVAMLDEAKQPRFSGAVAVPLG